VPLRQAQDIAHLAQKTEHASGYKSGLDGLLPKARWARHYHLIVASGEIKRKCTRRWGGAVSPLHKRRSGARWVWLGFCCATAAHGLPLARAMLQGFVVPTLPKLREEWGNRRSGCSGEIRS
jgi:hypothetical protein